jgi:hypothetical protein
MRRQVPPLAVSVVLIATLATATLAQRGGFRFRGGRDLTWGHANPDYTGRFTFSRVRFSGGSNAWNHDYPQADHYLPLILNEVTTLRPNLDGSNIFDLEDPDIFRNPILYIWEPGYWWISPEAAKNLRDYMLKGGFVIFDDFEANQWYNFEAQFRAALPDAVFHPLALDHPIYHSFFDMWSIDLPHPSVNVTPGYYAVYEDNDPTGRMMALVNHNADIAEYWEWSDRGRFALDLTNDAYKLGVNYIVYAMTH